MVDVERKAVAGANPHGVAPDVLTALGEVEIDGLASAARDGICIHGQGLEECFGSADADDVYGHLAVRGPEGTSGLCRLDAQGVIVVVTRHVKTIPVPVLAQIAGCNRTDKDTVNVIALVVEAGAIQVTHPEGFGPSDRTEVQIDVGPRFMGQVELGRRPDGATGTRCDPSVAATNGARRRRSPANHVVGRLTHNRLVLGCQGTDVNIVGIAHRVGYRPRYQRAGRVGGVGRHFLVARLVRGHRVEVIVPISGNDEVDGTGTEGSAVPRIGP